MSNSMQRMALATDDGRIHLYGLDSERTKLEIEPRLLTTINLKSAWEQAEQEKKSQESDLQPDSEEMIISSLPAWKTNMLSPNNNRSTTPTGLPALVERTSSATFLSYIRMNQPTSIKGSAKAAQQSWQGTCLLVGSHTGFMLIDAASNIPIKHMDTMACVGASGGGFATYGIRDSVELLMGDALTGDMLLFVIESRRRVPKGAIESSDGLQFGKETALGELVRNAVGTRARGPWSDKIYQDCMTELARLGVRSLKDVNASLKESIELSSVPGYIQGVLLARVDDQTRLSMVATESPQKGSALYTPIKSSKSAKKSSSGGTKRTPQKVDKMNQPTTFRKTVSSSGYTKPPTTTGLFKLPSIPSSKKPSQSKNLTRSPSSASLNSINWWMEDELPTSLEYEHICMMKQAGATTGVKFDSTGSYLATSSVDRTARVYRGKGDVHSLYSGHDTTVTSLSWSCKSSTNLLTCSMDGRAYMWSLGNTDPLLTFGPKKKPDSPSISSPQVSQTASANATELQQKISNVQFFYHDQFILATSGKSLRLIHYDIPVIDPKSVKPGLNYCSSKLRKLIELPGNISALCAPNTFKSHLAFIATGHSIQIVDMNKFEVAATANSAHSRTIHTIHLADYEHYADDSSSTSTSAFRNMFLTASVVDSIKLWDLRSPPIPTIHLLGHLNRFAPIKCSMSPCGRYVATGSEDKQVYIYDIRKGAVLDRLNSGFTDIVTGVDFHPTKPVLAVSCQDGRAHLIRLCR
jgi:WD40 repeat protein